MHAFPECNARASVPVVYTHIHELTHVYTHTRAHLEGVRKEGHGEGGYSASHFYDVALFAMARSVELKKYDN